MRTDVSLLRGSEALWLDSRPLHSGRAARSIGVRDSVGLVISIDGHWYLINETRINSITHFPFPIVFLLLTSNQSIAQWVCRQHRDISNGRKR